ncbi:MAG: AAA family ATPase [Alphaproteobacteria bacterium]|nr:AAA family ATPase [Alphaproteobacteria bacterium]MBT4020644.1 AAA family ATPase [Alphaproteobacteria bacterium]
MKMQHSEIDGANVGPPASRLLVPDPDTALRHLEGLYNDQMNGCVELAWTDAYGPLKHARMYEVSCLEEMAEKAAELNSVEGVNVYYGQALRHDTVEKSKRGSDADILALTAVYCDLDDAGATEAARLIYAEVGIKPTAIVVTGNYPHTRAQLHWRLDEPVYDPAEMRRINSAICVTFNGDPTVVNPSRVLRLPGTIAWPHKPGRIAEMTQLIDRFPDNRPRSLMIEHIDRVFSERGSKEINLLATAAEPAAKTVNDTSLVTGITNPETLLKDIKDGVLWHNNTVRLVGHYLSRGWSDEEIVRLSSEITMPGYTVDQTKQEIERAILDGRRKWNIQKPNHALTEQYQDHKAEPGPILASSFKGTPPPRQWLMEQWIPENTVSILYGNGGIGKTIFAHQLAAHVAAGQDFMGVPVKRNNALCVLCEDDIDEVHRRQNDISLQQGFGDALDKLHLWSRVGHDNLMMTFDGKSAGQITPFYEEIREYALEHSIGFILLDVAADLFGGNENSKSDVTQFLKSGCARLTLETDSTVLLLAHPSVAGMASGSGISGNTAWNNSVRSRLYLTNLPDEEGGITNEDMRLLTRMKANYAQKGAKIYMQWVEGAFVPKDIALHEASLDLSTYQVREILSLVRDQWDKNTPYSSAPQSGIRYIIPVIVDNFDVTEKVAKGYLRDWMKNGILEEATVNKKSKMRGLKVINFPS